MKNKQPAKGDAIVLSRICKLIPEHLVSKLATIRGATPPAKNTLSHVNKTRDSDMMEELFWETLKHLQATTPQGFGIRYQGLPRRFNKTISAVDSSTIALVANSLNWAKHRRRKAAAKMHLRLNLQTFLPACAIIEEASHHDDTRAQQLCAHLEDGEIVLFDKAYINFLHLYAVVALYKSRWGIEVFFKQIKQTLCISDFLGHNKNAIRWQLWSALLLYVLLRHQAQQTGWPHSFARLFTMLRGVIWDRICVTKLLEHYGTAGGLVA